MRSKTTLAWLLVAALGAAPALADRGSRHGRSHDDGHRYRERVHVVHRPVVIAAPPGHYRHWRAPVRNHYHGHSHHGYRDRNDAYLWIGGALVLSEIIHHANHHH
jgi:hypothetical protein